eukprot:scaffold48029_cov69-Phaeocystis_antarctica.AAC.9
MAATAATEQGAVCDPSSIAGAPSSQLERGRPTVPPPSWSELAYRRHYVELAGKSATEQGVPPGAQFRTAGKSAASALTWAELAAEPEAVLAPPIARAAASQQRDAESAGVARLTPGQERCMYSTQPELAAEDPECVRAINEWLPAINT